MYREMNAQERIIACACLARTNYGHLPLTPEGIKWLWLQAQNPNAGISLGSAVHFTCQDIVETDEHLEMFTDEAESWHVHYMNTSTEDLLRTFPSLRETIGPHLLVKAQEGAEANSQR